MKKITAVLFILMFMAGCAWTSTTKTAADGSTIEITAWHLWSDGELDNLKSTKTTLSIEAQKTDTESMEAMAPVVDAMEGFLEKYKEQ